MVEPFNRQDRRGSLAENPPGLAAAARCRRPYTLNMVKVTRPREHLLAREAVWAIFGKLDLLPPRPLSYPPPKPPGQPSAVLV
jgi:hypothetical protein